MTTTTTGPNGFPVRYIVMAVVASALAAMIVAISQQAGPDVVQTISAPKQATTEIVASGASANGLADALESGKLDEGGGQAQSSTATPHTPAPRIVEVTGQGSNYDALIAGKFTADFGPDANVEFVRAPQAAVGGLWKALADGKLDESVVSTQPSTVPTATNTVSGGHQE